MSRVSKNIVYNLMGQGLIVLLGFWGTRVVFHRLGDEALGILYFALALNAVLTPLLDMGVSSTVVREVARHLHTDRDYLLRLARTATLFYWSAYALLAAGVWFSAPWLVTRWIHLQTLSVPVAIETLRFLALALLLMLPRSLYSNLLRGVERMEMNNLVDVGMTAVRQGGTILVVVFGGGLVGIAYFYLGCFVVNIAAYVLAAKRFFPWLALTPGFSSAVVKQNARFTVRVGAYTMLGMVQMESDKAILSKLVSVGLLGFYGVAQTMVARVNQIPGAVMQAAFPKLSKLYHQRDHEAFRHEYRRLQDLVCYGMVPVFAAVIFAATPLFTILLNEYAARALFWPTFFLCVGWYMNGTLNLPAVVALAADRPDIGARQNLYALAVVTPITALLIWKWALVGAALSFVVYHFFAYSYGARRVAAECLGIRPVEWYLHVVKVLALGIASFVPGWFLASLAGPDFIPLLICGYAAGFAIFVPLAYVTVGKELRDGLTVWRQKAVAASLTYFAAHL